MSPRRRAAVAACTRSMMTSASGSAGPSGQPITSSAQPQSQISVSSSASVAASSVTSSAHASSEQTSLATYMKRMVHRPSDGMHEFAQAVLLRGRRLLLGDARQRRVVLVEIGRRAERLVGDLGGRVVGRRAVLGDLLVPLDLAL